MIIRKLYFHNARGQIFNNRPYVATKKFLLWDVNRQSNYIQYIYFSIHNINLSQNNL